jgi:hypothetical protein
VFTASGCSYIRGVYCKRMFLHTREANEVRAHTEASTLASRDRDGRRKRVEERERREGGNADGHDFTEVRLLRVQDEHRDERNDEALNQILEHSG